MLHSTVTSKGQTTIPGEIRRALGIKPGGRLTYEMSKDKVTVRVHPGIMALKGALADGKFKRNLPFAKIRALAAKEAVRRWKQERDE